MQLEVLLFAAAREAAGSDTIRLTLAEPAGRRRDRRDRPRVAAAGTGCFPSCRLAIDCAYVTSETRSMNACSEIALIPPVSGG